MPFLPNQITKDHIIRAANRIEKESIELLPSMQWDVEIDENLYPPKEIMRFAHEEMNGERIWNYSGGEQTNAILKTHGFEIKAKIFADTKILELIDAYKSHICTSKLENERYKWELVQQFKGRPDVNTENFKDEIQALDFANLVYAMSNSVRKFLAEEKPEEFRTCFQQLFDDQIDLSQRVRQFTEQTLKLYKSLNGSHGHHQDERTISAYLTYHNPDKYTFYKNSFYQAFCKLLDVKTASKNKKYAHYLELLNEFISGYIQKDEELIDLVKSLLPKLYDGKNHLLLAQDILYTMLEGIDNSEHFNYQKDFEKWLKKSNGKGSNKVASYLRAIELLQESLDYVIYETDDLDLLGELHVDLIANQKNIDGPYYNASAPPSYANNGFYSASIGAYLEFQKERNAKSELREPKTNYSMPYSLNEILYGPPGTGKTYETKSKAVEIITGNKIEKRDELNAEYNRLVESKNILFSTFHQSMSYEDFVEGIKPVTEDGQVSYEIQDGIFKQISSLAKGVDGRIEKQESAIDFSTLEFFKMSLGGKNRKDVHDWCITNNVIALGYGGNNDLDTIGASNWKDYQVEFQENFPQLVEKSSYNVNSTYYFKNVIKLGDVVLVSKGNRIIDAVGIVTGNYEYRESEEIPYHHFRKVRWIATNMNADPSLFVDKNISQQTIYQFYNDDIKVDYFEKKFSKSKKETEFKNHVLIIDEINRGNVSAIFGELITLIEEDKRLGAKEEIKVTLPYSKEEFGVPSNLYIIGTMNTADRSVEALDTALRRRFSFKEVGPKPELIREVGKAENGEVEGVDLVQLLSVINQRIEVLLDKDHCIGHSYFLNVASLRELKAAFQDKIIPLLQEYFYGDYGKIGLVLGEGFVKKSMLTNHNIFAIFDDYDASMYEEKNVYHIIQPCALKDNEFKQALNQLIG
ncbi:AAA domain (dynein-related subfamily) [Lishizhenia tianjinensis]|uniref:AAA domain (Dynein-related subfamily) n=1 Tax=Lishizhenia tianjinensis TaxID=477690 RepID=A0A1I6XE48_9FLAO|nr:AAA family ATPase [Lishizhenia tianjinensis]SFT36343.1 AAA domain (dynein-related subfamily) [Lishizhenia tianjinensis]